MSRIKPAVITVIVFAALVWAMPALALPEAGLLVPPSTALPAPEWFMKALLLLTFFVHLILVNILLGSLILAIVDRRGTTSRETGVLPKVLALAVNFGIAPFLFLQVIYGNVLYPSISLMAVWWMSIALFVMLAYYGLYVRAGVPRRRILVLALSALLLLATAFLLTNISTLMLSPDRWLQWFSNPNGTMLNWGDPSLLPRYLHILLASLAVGGLTMAWRERWRVRRSHAEAGSGAAIHAHGDAEPVTVAVVADVESGRAQGGAERGLHNPHRMTWGLDWFFYVSLAQIPVGLLFLWTLPPDVRALFLGGSALPTSALLLAVAGLGAALFAAWRGKLAWTSATALGIVLVMIGIRDMVRDAMLQPYRVAEPIPLAMPGGQTAVLALFLVCTALTAVVLVGLGRTAFHAVQIVRARPASEIREG